MLIDWDDSKSEHLKRDRGLSLEECVEMFLVGHVSDQKSDVPEQYFAIGFVQGQLITLIYEYRQNEDQEIIWLITYWKATKREAQLYEQKRK
jgi:uncharacterized DUF497 family protein